MVDEAISDVRSYEFWDFYFSCSKCRLKSFAGIHIVSKLQNIW